MLRSCGRFLSIRLNHNFFWKQHFESYPHISWDILIHVILTKETINFNFLLLELQPPGLSFLTIFIDSIFFHPISHANISAVYNFQKIFFERLFRITYSNIKHVFCANSYFFKIIFSKKILGKFFKQVFQKKTNFNKLSRSFL